ncbi:MAG: polysaccharide biosynthesis C-terminal domain-containing protein [Bacilli bacterium]
MAVGLSLLAKPVFYAFYGDSMWGPLVFCFTIFISLFRCIFTTSVSIAQSLNKFRNVFLSIIVGIVIKYVLNVPFMVLFDKFGLYPFYGSTFATLLGLFISFMINFACINKIIKLDIEEIFKSIFKFIYPIVIMIIVIVIMKHILPFNFSSRFNAVITIGVYGLTGTAIYLGLTYLNGSLKKLFGTMKRKNMVK